MGLDMYLTKKIYIGANYDHNQITGEITLKKEGKPIKINLKRITTVDERVGYWRKANHIHQWFVRNVQDGEDDCKEYYVSRDQLKQLLEDCQAVKKVSKTKKFAGVAKDTLPTQSGFFLVGLTTMSII